MPELGNKELADGSRPPRPFLEFRDGVEEVDGVVDAGVDVLLSAAQVRAKKDAPGDNGYHAQEILVHHNRGPVFTGRELVNYGASGFL